MSELTGKGAALAAAPGNGRMIEQDIAKGVAIILVLALHTLTLKRSIYTIVGGFFGYIMPFFFFMAGYNHRPGRYTYRQIIARRTKQIAVPFLKYTFAITVIAGAYYMITKGYTLRMVGETYLALLITKSFSTVIGLETAEGLFTCVMAGWFLEMLFTASLVFYAVADYALAKASRLLSVIPGLLLVTMLFAHFDFRLPFYICEAPAIAAIMLVGAFFGQKQLLSNRFPRRSIVINSLVSYALFVLLAAAFQGAGFIAGGRLWNSTLKEWTVLLSAAFAVTGTYPFVHACRSLRNTGVLAKGLIWCGNHSMQLLLIHGIVQLFLCELLGMEPFRMSFSANENDFRTFYLLALEIAVSALVILALGRMKKAFSRKSAVKG